MYKSRLIRKRTRRRKKGLIELDITSLLDILVIMLVFLLRSYNSSGIVLNVPRGIQLPKSASITLNNPGVIVQVSPTKIWVDDKLIVDIDKNPPGNMYDHHGKRIIPLYNELMRKKRLVKIIKKSSKEAKDFSGVINLVVDKSLKYKFVKKLLYTSAEAGFKQFKFIVLGENQ